MKEGELYRSKYKILKVFKETTEACVLLAEHVQLNSYWIIKQLKNVSAETIQEVDVLKGVNHPGIPMIVDVISEDHSIVIIREYVEGENLNDYGKNGLSQEEIVNIGLKICSIVRFLHEDLSSPLIFRDIKPGNIIMTNNGELKLIDFGIARFYKEELSHDTTYLGTKGFASPEQYGVSQSDVRTDVFGLGATLYFLMTKSDLGKPPYKILPVAQFRNDIDKSLELIIVKACAINKNQRFQSIREFEESLLKLVKVDEHISWYEKLKLTNLDMMVFSGLRPGAGTTYTTMRLARFLSHHSMIVSIIDCSNNQQLQSLEFQDGILSKNGGIEYEGINIVSINQLNKDSTKNLLKRFKDTQLIIIDFGCYDQVKNLKLSEEFDQYNKLRTYIVAHISPWEIDLFEEFVLSDEDHQNINMIINSSSKQRFQGIKKSLVELNLFSLPFMPFEQLKDDDGFCQELIKGWEVYDHWPKKQSFLNPSHYKTKLLKRIK